MGGVPETHYARDGDAHFAYQVLGDNGPDLLLVPSPNFPIDLVWDEPVIAAHLRRLASFSRLIVGVCNDGVGTLGHAARRNPSPVRG